MRLTRIHAEAVLHEGAEVSLPAAGSHHLARVLRLKEGSPVVVFDGSGGEYRAEIIRISGGTVHVNLKELVPGVPESPLRLTLVQGISRSERMDWTLQKATELGVAAIVPILAARSVVRLDDKQALKKQQHWRSIVISACEQCGRSVVPQIAPPAGLQEYLASSPKEGFRLVLSPTAPGSLAGIASMPGRVELLIGPEGGLDDEEIGVAEDAGFLPVRLGPRVLRTETASVVALSVLQSLWGDLQ